MPVLAELDQLLEVARQRDVALRRLLRLLHRPREVEELAQVALDVDRVREHEPHVELDHLRELVRPAAHERLARRDRQRQAVDRDRQDAEALGVGHRHRRGDGAQVDLQRVDVEVRHLQLAGEPFHQRFQRQQLPRRLGGLPVLRGDHFERMLVLPRARAPHAVGVGRRHEAVRHHELQDVVEVQPPVRLFLRLGRGRRRAGGRRARRGLPGLGAGCGSRHPAILHRGRGRPAARPSARGGRPHGCVANPEHPAGHRALAHHRPRHRHHDARASTPGSRLGSAWRRLRARARQSVRRASRPAPVAPRAPAARRARRAPGTLRAGTRRTTGRSPSSSTARR